MTQKSKAKTTKTKAIDPLEAKLRRMEKRKKAKTVGVRKDITAGFLSCVKTVAERLSEFTSDDVRAEFDRDNEGVFNDVDPRITGPIMKKAQKLGYCQITSKSAVSDRRQSGLTRVYRSLLCLEDPLDIMTADDLRAEVRRLRGELDRLRGVAAE